ncbi:MAG: T9SS type A sorting domain-containing protein [Paludibacter sp.]
MKTKITFLMATLAITLNLFAGAVTVPIGSTATVTDIQTAMSDAVTAGNTDITLQFPDGYVLGTSASNGDVTLTIPAGVTKLTLYAAPSVSTKPTLYLNTFTFSDGLMAGGLIIDGLNVKTGTVGRYLIQPSASTATKIPSKVTIRNSWIEGYRVVFNSSLATTTSEINYYNNYFKNIANGGIITVTTGSVPVINIKKNTFNNVGGDASGTTGSDYFIDFRTASSVSSAINFSNNTIYYPRTQGRGLFRLSSGTFTTGYIKENNNLYSTGNATSFALQLLYTNSTGAISDADSTNYYSNKMTLGSNKGSISTAVYTENSPSNLFMNPAGDDFTITDANFVGKSVAGDPRWFPQPIVNPKALTTSVSPANAGTVAPSLATVAAGTVLSLTATKAFGYAFKEWRSANTNEVVSTSNPYSVTMNTDTSLVAVFDPVTTYDFTLNKVGSNWANVSVSPAAVNGKYETGTSVTLTVVPNGVASFVNWEDNSTATPRIITMDANKTVTANFTETPFITGWDFKVASPNTNRSGDYYSDAANKGAFKIYNQDGSETSWLSNTGSFSPSTPCAYLWTPGATFATNRRYFQASFSTLGITNVTVASQIAASYQHYLTQKLQASTNGTDFADVASVDVSTTTWGNLNATLGAAYENQATVYLRWIANTGSALLGNATDNDGTAITNVYVYGVKMTTGFEQTEMNQFAYAVDSKIYINNAVANGEVKLYNTMGQLIDVKQIVSMQTVFEKNIKSGIYIVKFNSDSKEYAQKLIVK